ncbi:hypothetical protein TCAL_06363 [Tigriopus californicus]|uniref:Luciferin 4-monooxygenase n=1 Tax=Tigriopus californicus TaxID=6832 RepID=A0A553PH51_TIGCA|nr:uncharacterized protein LOC131880679 [Tigriopus californicus]TRY77011.1 hypothetical protein TCAL_06363 [Tigriopus californicus]
MPVRLLRGLLPLRLGASRCMAAGPVAGWSGLPSRYRLSTSVGLRKYVPVVVPAADEDKVVRSPYSDVELPECNLADFVWKNVHQWPDNIAMICGMTGRQYTYDMAYGMSRKFGSAMIRMGAKKGDVFAMVVPNIPEFPIAFLGAVGVGLTPTTMNPTYRPEEIARQLENSQARFIITIGLFLPNIRQACEIYSGIEKIIVLGMEEKPADCASFIEMLIYDDGSLYDQDRSCDPHNDLAALPYSSGTTGPPKGVSLTHFNMVSNLVQLLHPQVNNLRECNPTSKSNQEITVAVLPFFHIYAMTAIMNLGLHLGAKIITLPKFEPEAYLKALVTYKPTFLHLVPPLVSFLSTNPAVKAQHLASLEAVIGGAAPFGPALIEKLMEKCKPNVVNFREGFGMTESSPVSHVQPEENAVLGGCGHPIPNTLAKIVDLETGVALGPNEDGELLVAGPQVMKGYFKNKKATNKTIVDGWLRTGDIAKFDETGQFMIVDRLKELIKVKGLQVAPSELEDLIRRHEGVNDVAVVGVPDERSGELPRAYVVRKNRNVLEQDIIDFVAERVAPHKKLGAGVMFVETLPKNQTGKILRRELKAQVFKGSFGY